MRIHNQRWTIRKILTSPPATILYFAVFSLFLYWNFRIIPVWLTMSGRVEKAENDLQILKNKNDKKEEVNKTLKTDEGKARYEKEFFSKLDDGEKLIILYGDVATVTKVEENLRKMSWYESKKQDFLVWVRNMNW